jgi:hypothetical protein
LCEEKGSFGMKGGWSVTLQEFNYGVRRYQRLVLILLGVTGLAIATYGIAVVGFAGPLLALGNRLFGPAQANLISPLAAAPVVVLMLAGSAFIQQIVSRDRRVVCSHCQRLLASGTVRLVTVATGNCPFCGQRVIEEPDAKPGVATDQPRGSGVCGL